MNLKFFFFLTSMMLMSSEVLAVSLRFKFDINSSGPSIYACDAGIRHRFPRQEKICYSRIDGGQCNPRVVCKDSRPAAECECVCTGSNIGGNTHQDSLFARFSHWVDNGEIPQGTYSQSRTASHTHAWSTLFGGGKQSFGKLLTHLEFNLSSEQYGAEMFLDVCYRGSQIEFYKNRLGGYDTPNHKLNAIVTVTDLSNNQTDYVDLAGLKTRAEVHCDLQGVGTYIYAHDQNGEYDNWWNQQLNADANGNIIGGDPLQMAPVSPLVTPQANAITLLHGWINFQNHRAPRYCKVRYYLAETAQFFANPLDRIRKWQHQKVRVCTYTSIEQFGNHGYNGPQ